MRDEERGVWLAPEEGHDGSELWGMLDEGFQRFVPKYCTKSVFDVSGNVDMVRAGSGQGTEVVNHFICACSHESTILEYANCVDDVCLRDI